MYFNLICTERVIRLSAELRAFVQIQNLSCRSFQRCLLTRLKTNGVSRERTGTARQFKLGFTLHKRSRSGVELNVVIGNEMDLP